MPKWKAKLKELCAIDIRSLALFRIGLALVLLGDLFVRVQDVRSHYSDDGVLPRDILIDKILGIWNLSLHFINGTWQIQLVLFILAGLAAIALLIGYKTRIATVISWILTISLHARNPMVLQGGDLVMKMLLFWGMFLPLGAYWSIDQLKKAKISPSTQVISFGSIALLLQVCFIYWFTAILKNHPIWVSEGSAVWYALSIEQYATPFGVYMLQFPTLLKWLTFATFYLEAVGPFFAFSPIFTGPLRFATVIAFLCFHLIGLNFTMELGPFPYICAVAWIAFVPKWFWDKFYKKKEEDAPAWKTTLPSNILAGLCISYIFLWNVTTLEVKIPVFQNRLGFLGPLFSVDQEWNMFSPYPLRADGWFVIPATLRDGTTIDLYKESRLSWKKPPLLAATYKNDRWRSYMMNLFLEYDESLLLGYGRYLTREWNKTHPYDKQLLSFDIFYMLKMNTLGAPKVPPSRIHLWHHNAIEE